MDTLWAPWRVAYIRGKKSSSCIFCRSVASNPSGNFIVFKTGFSFCMLNTYPYNNGHVMVSPIRHTGSLESLTDEERNDLFASVVRAKKLLDRVLKPHGYNLGINLGDVAGAGVPGHIHIHIVPRWKGDTNFMPAACKTKVISQSLKELYALLKNAESKK